MIKQIAVGGLVSIVALTSTSVTDMFGVTDIRLIVINLSPSIAPGVYVRSFDDVEIGSTVSFSVPESVIKAVRNSSEERAERLSMQRLLKPVVGVESDVICRRGTAFSINGRVLGAAITGDDIPTWEGCHYIKQDEMAVFSDRIPSSIDNRYYPPVSTLNARTYRLILEF